MLIDGVKNEKIGLMPMAKAERMGSEPGLELVCVAPKAKPQVYKLMASAMLRDAEARKAKEEKAAAREKSRLDRLQRERAKAEAKLTKELKLTAMSEKHDRDVRLRKARGYLAKGLRVKFTLTMKRNQPKSTAAQDAFMAALIEELEDCGVPSGAPVRSGQWLSCTLAPLS